MQNNVNTIISAAALTGRGIVVEEKLLQRLACGNNYHDSWKCREKKTVRKPGNDKIVLKADMCKRGSLRIARETKAGTFKAVTLHKRGENSIPRTQICI